jgi:hypothetical protein
MNMNKIISFFPLLCFFSETLAAPSDTLKLYAFKLDTTMSCQEARQRYIDDSCSNIDECNALLLYAKRCDLRSHNAKNPTDKKFLITKVEVTPEGEERILFGLMDIGTGVDIANLAKAAVTVLTGNAFLKDRYTAAVVDFTGKYAIDSYLEAAIRNDEFLIFAPAYIPAIKLAEDALNEISTNKHIKKMTLEVREFSKGMINELANNPRKLIAPIEVHTMEIIGKELKIVDSFVDATGKMITEAVKIPLDVLPKDLSELGKNPRKYITNKTQQTVDEVKDFIKKVRIKVSW